MLAEVSAETAEAIGYTLVILMGIMSVYTACVAIALYCFYRRERLQKEQEAVNGKAG